MKENTAMKEEIDYRYDYREMDRFLSEEQGPQVMGDQLEDLMCGCGHGVGSAGDLASHYHILCRLRDLFRRMHPKTANR